MGDEGGWERKIGDAVQSGFKSAMFVCLPLAYVLYLSTATLTVPPWFLRVLPRSLDA